MIDSEERERLRIRYRPAHVKVLFVGESPPMSGAFFYRGDSDLYKATKRVFEAVCGQTWTGDDPEPFLRWLRGAGCYLDDLSHEPINHFSLRDPTEKKLRMEGRQDSVSGLAERIRRAAPLTMIVVGKGIEANVRSALDLAGAPLVTELYSVSFPGWPPQHQRAFTQELTAALEELNDLGILLC